MQPLRDMDGPSFYCAYLGFIAISKPPTNISVVQSPVKELYFKYRKTPASGRSASLKLIQKGVLVILYEDGSVKAELFFDFSSVTFVEAAKFVTVKTSSEKKPKAMFVPVDESKGAVSDKNAFLLEKNFHFLISSTHPPLVVCVVRRPAGVKALDCHVFALDTIENALHISALIGSTQMPAGQINKIDGGGDASRAKGGFDRGVRGDVIRMDHGDYSVYRGHQGYESPPPTQRYSGGPVPDSQSGPRYGGAPMHEAQPGQRYSGGPVQSPGWNGHMGPPPGGMPSPVMLTQDNFRDSSSPSQPYGGGPGVKGYGMYEGPNYGGPPGGQFLRQPDVIMHTRQRSGDSAENPHHDRSFSGADQSPASSRMRYDEVSMRNSANTHSSGGPVYEGRTSGGPGPASGNRLSANLVPQSGKMSPRPSDMAPPGYMGGPQFSNWQPDPAPSPNSPVPGVNSPRSPQVFSPTSPRGYDGGGPVFSASNLESRSQEPESEEYNVGGRPVAKVPPHMIGVKVLPTDFKMVKLKTKADKRPEVSDNEDYDNNKELLTKYKELQEHERDPNQSPVMKQPALRTSNYPEGDGFRDFESNKTRHDDRSRDFMSQWNDSVKDYKSGGGGTKTEDSPVMFRRGGPRDYPQRYEDNNNKNRFSSPGYEEDNQFGRHWDHRSQPPYSTGDNSFMNDDPQTRTKNMEIASMFSNIRLQGGNNPRDMYGQPRDRNEIEEGLGYLP